MSEASRDTEMSSSEISHSTCGGGDKHVVTNSSRSATVPQCVVIQTLCISLCAVEWYTAGRVGGVSSSRGKTLRNKSYHD